jgi:hypothetical protein
VSPCGDAATGVVVGTAAVVGDAALPLEQPSIVSVINAVSAGVTGPPPVSRIGKS